LVPIVAGHRLRVEATLTDISLDYLRNCFDD
jgi:hypothetical protein